jgi:hypothetical protein
MQVAVVAVVLAATYPTPTVLTVNPAGTVVEPWSSCVHPGEKAQATQRADQVPPPLEQAGLPLIAPPPGRYGRVALTFSRAGVCYS